jgi:hypothetical protein
LKFTPNIQISEYSRVIQLSHTSLTLLVLATTNMASLAEHQQFANLWNRAVQEYLDITGNDLKDHSIPKPESVEELTKSVTEQHAEFSAFRQRGAEFRKCLAYALSPIKVLGNLAAGGASTVIIPPSNRSS